MYKKILSLSLFLSLLPFVAFSADDPSRFRLYVPAMTSTTVDDCTTCTVAVSGSSLHYVFGFGLGLGVTSSKATISQPDGNPTSFYYDSGQMIDLSYTFGSEFTFTLGYGMGSAPTGDLFTKMTGKSATNTFIGFGYDFGGFEVLLGMRNTKAVYDAEYTYSYEFYGETYTGTNILPDQDASWNSTDIGLGFTF